MRRVLSCGPGRAANAADRTSRQHLQLLTTLHVEKFPSLATTELMRHRTSCCANAHVTAEPRRNSGVTTSWCPCTGYTNRHKVVRATATAPQCLSFRERRAQSANAHPSQLRNLYGKRRLAGEKPGRRSFFAGNCCWLRSPCAGRMSSCHSRVPKKRSSCLPRNASPQQQRYASFVTSRRFHVCAGQNSCMCVKAVAGWQHSA